MIIAFTLSGGFKAMASKMSVPTVGFIPTAFPRDPTEINVFLEHVALGQVIEPLVSTDKEGNVAAGLAKKWEFSNDSKKIIFTLESGLVFSTGAPVTAEDVKFSIERHMQSNSQSKPYLQCIEKINVKSKTEIEFVLNEAQPALIKALSRDHLGVLPKGWAFNKQSNEPYTGTGPYRAVKQHDGWHYILNSHYRNKTTLLIPNWKILLSDEPETEISEGIIPDYMPFSASIVTSRFYALPEKIKDKYLVAEQNHFAQLSAWWYPHGNNFMNEQFKVNTMCAMKKYLRRRAEAKGLKSTTGVIPVGVAGYLPAAVNDLPGCKNSSEIIEIKVAVVRKDLLNVEDAATAADFLKNENVKFSFFPFDAPQMHRLKETKPDVVTGSWAGGFNDPQGFLPILSNLLSIDLVDYFGKLSPLYLVAKREGDWTKRAAYFRSLNEKLQVEQLMAPGWKENISLVNKKNLVVQSENMRYSPKLVDISFASQVKP